MAEFVFATCLPGLEPAVKREVARTRPELRFAYSRPGLLTFKAPATIAPDDPPGSVFARVWGRSVGAARDPDAARTMLAAATRLHVFAREPTERHERTSGDVPVAIDPAWAALDGGAAAIGDVIGDVIVDADGAWLGMHRHDAKRSPLPGGGEPFAVPADAPSRAFAKIEEAIGWAQLPIEAGHVALEIGAAPGGAVLALARRGLEVWAVDTGDLAPVTALPLVHHLAIKVGALRWEDLPPRIDWLLLDVNLAPQVAIHEISRLMPRLRSTLRGAVLTLKLNDWTFVDQLPALVTRIRELGFVNVALRHLPSNRREICAVCRI